MVSKSCHPREPIVKVVGHEVGTDVEADQSRHDPWDVSGSGRILAECAGGVMNRGSRSETEENDAHDQRGVHGDHCSPRLPKHAVDDGSGQEREALAVFSGDESTLHEIRTVAIEPHEDVIASLDG